MELKRRQITIKFDNEKTRMAYLSGRISGLIWGITKTNAVEHVKGWRKDGIEYERRTFVASDNDFDLIQTLLIDNEYAMRFITEIITVDE